MYSKPEPCRSGSASELSGVCAVATQPARFLQRASAWPQAQEVALSTGLVPAATGSTAERPADAADASAAPAATAATAAASISASCTYAYAAEHGSSTW